MKNITGLQVPGTESFGSSESDVPVGLSREFLREIAQLLETEIKEASPERNVYTKALPRPYLPAERFSQGIIWEYEDE